ncbi:MAG: hypothetical protein ABSD50_15220 [Smithella sp.]
MKIRIIIANVDFTYKQMTLKSFDIEYYDLKGAIKINQSVEIGWLGWLCIFIILLLLQKSA